MLKFVLAFALSLQMPVQAQSNEQDKFFTFLVFKEVAANYLKVKSPLDLAEVIGRRVSESDKTFIKEVFKDAKKLPKLRVLDLAVFEMSFESEKLEIDLSRLKEKVIFINDQKFLFDPTAPLAVQNEMLLRKLYSKEKNFGKYQFLLNLIFPSADANESKYKNFKLSAGDEPLKVLPSPATAEAAAGLSKSKRVINWTGTALKRVYVGVASLSLVAALFPKLTDTATSTIVELTVAEGCQSAEESFVYNLDVCKKVRLQNEQDRNIEPRRFGLVDTRKVPASAGLFATKVRVCPEESESNSYAGQFSVVGQKLQKNIKEAPPLASADKVAEIERKRQEEEKSKPKRILEVQAVLDGPENVQSLTIFEKGKKIATMKVVKNIPTDIEVPNDNFDPKKNPTMEGPNLKVKVAKEVVAKTKDDTRLESIRQMGLDIIDHVGVELRICTFIKSGYLSPAGSQPTATK